jgi:hypothetical protein
MPRRRRTVILAVSPARAQWLTFFFNTANLDPIARSPQVRILAAQSSSRIAQADVNAFDDFFLINGPGMLEVNFNGQLQVKSQKPLPHWLGNSPYSNHEIFYDLQAGFLASEGKIQFAERTRRKRHRVQDDEHQADRVRLCREPDPDPLPAIPVYARDRRYAEGHAGELLLDAEPEAAIAARLAEVS